MVHGFKGVAFGVIVAAVAAVTVFSTAARASTTAGDDAPSSTTTMTPLQLDTTGVEAAPVTSEASQAIAKNRASKRKVCCTLCSTCRSR